MPERMMIQERRARKPRPESELRKASIFSVLSHAAATKYGVEVQTDDPSRLHHEFVAYCQAWRDQHGDGPLSRLKFKTFDGKVRIYREITNPNEAEF